jgi:hypothetical protein
MQPASIMCRRKTTANHISYYKSLGEVGEIKANILEAYKE